MKESDAIKLYRKELMPLQREIERLRTAYNHLARWINDTAVGEIDRGNVLVGCSGVLQYAEMIRTGEVNPCDKATN